MICVNIQSYGARCDLEEENASGDTNEKLWLQGEWERSGYLKAITMYVSGRDLNNISKHPSFQTRTSAHTDIYHQFGPF